MPEFTTSGRQQLAIEYMQEKLRDAVRRRGGVVRRTTLARIGFTERSISRAVSRRSLVVVRRVWLALPDADGYLVAAAREGVVVTCITQAVRLGLWVLDSSGPPHVAAPAHAGRVCTDGRMHLHRAKPLIVRTPEQLADPIENMLNLVAHCQPREDALMIWESAMNKGLVTRQRMQRLPLKEPAKQIAAEATPFSDSGLETIVPPRLRWTGLRITPQTWIAGHGVDFLIGDRLVLQIDGRHHVGAQRDSDIRHDAELMLMGYHVIRVGYAQVIDDWPSVLHRIQVAIAQGLHLAQ